MGAPADLLFAVVRDRLPELVWAFDDVERITRLVHEELAGHPVRVVHEWCAAQRLPAVLAGAVGSAQICWIDRAEWDAATLTCQWSIEPSVLTEHIECRGSTTYLPTPDGRGTRVEVQGTFHLAKGALRGLAAPLNRPLGAFVEALITTIIPKHTRSMIEAAATVTGPPG